MLRSLPEPLASLQNADLIPYGAAALALLLCFGVMEWIVLKWKRKYRDLSHRHQLLQDRLELEQHYSREKVELLERAGADMRVQFRNLAQDIFEEKAASLRQQSGRHIDALLSPFQEQLQQFRDRVETVFLEETREHSSLRQELVHLRELNYRLNEEATNLTRAIAGDRKLQGTWGEVVLERLLEQSGLRRGREFETQKGFRDERNRLFKPDVIVHLPDGKDIVIDSKVSLSAWARYVGATDDDERASAMKQHTAALRQHLKSLGAKDYSSLPALRSLDFVLMFVPIDAAFMSAIGAEEQLLDEMYSRRVLIVTPTTLLATLRTIEHFWREERQSRNAVEIADRAAALYDKLRGFLEEMEKLGRSIDACRDSYDRALAKLSRGRGNLVSQASVFPELGIKVKNEMPRCFSEEAARTDETPPDIDQPADRGR